MALWKPGTIHHTSLEGQTCGDKAHYSTHDPCGPCLTLHGCAATHRLHREGGRGSGLTRGLRAQEEPQGCCGEMPGPSPVLCPQLPPRSYPDGELRQSAGLEAPDQGFHAVNGPGDLGGGRRGQLHLGVVPERGQARLRVRHGGCGRGEGGTRVYSAARGPPRSPLPVPGAHR